MILLNICYSLIHLLLIGKAREHAGSGADERLPRGASVSIRFEARAAFARDIRIAAHPPQWPARSAGHRLSCGARIEASVPHERIVREPSSWLTTNIKKYQWKV